MSGDAALFDAALFDAAAGDGGAADWGTPTVALTDMDGVQQPSVTPDELEIFAGNFVDISTATRPSTAVLFGPLATVSVSTSPIEFDPEISADGLELYFVRSGSIYRATRATRASAWTSPVIAFGGQSPALTDDMLTLYYLSSGTVVRRTRASLTAAWGVGVAVELSEAASYNSVSISGDELHLILDTTSDPSVPAAIEVTRPTAISPWTSIRPILAFVTPALTGCDFFAGPDVIYCAGYNSLSVWEIYRVARE